jgi:hypothetical protein
MEQVQPLTLSLVAASSNSTVHDEEELEIFSNQTKKTSGLSLIDAMSKSVESITQEVTIYNR